MLEQEEPANLALAFALPCNSETSSLWVIFGSISASPCSVDIPRGVNLARSSAGTAFPKWQEVAEGGPSAIPAHMARVRTIPPVPDNPPGVTAPKESF